MDWNGDKEENKKKSKNLSFIWSSVWFNLPHPKQEPYETRLGLE